MVFNLCKAQVWQTKHWLVWLQRLKSN